jgi:hypothetical protein
MRKNVRQFPFPVKCALNGKEKLLDFPGKIFFYENLLTWQVYDVEYSIKKRTLEENMLLTPDEAQESLAAVEAMMQKVRRSLAQGGAPYHLILWGGVWFFGFLGSHFFSERTAGLVWLGLDVIGALGSWTLGMMFKRRVRNAGAFVPARRMAMFWLTLFFYCMLVGWIARPLDGKQLAMLIVIFAMLGWTAMGFLMSLSLVKFALLVTAVAFAGYYLLPNCFYLWMALLGSGTMIGCGLSIRSRWRQA